LWKIVFGKIAVSYNKILIVFRKNKDLGSKKFYILERIEFQPCEKSNKKEVFLIKNFISFYSSFPFSKRKYCVGYSIGFNSTIILKEME